MANGRSNELRAVRMMVTGSVGKRLDVRSAACAKETMMLNGTCTNLEAAR